MAGTGTAFPNQAAALPHLFIATAGNAFTAGNSTDRLRLPFPTDALSVTALKQRSRPSPAVSDLWFIFAAASGRLLKKWIGGQRCVGRPMSGFAN
jgi:hypothetical protein